MIKRMKKGFTLVELVVVIAVVAILAAVSVVTYMSITKKAKESHDQQIIDQINLSLSAEETAGRKPETMHKALEVLEKDGFAPERFNSLYGPTIGYDLAYLLKENKFVLLTKDTSTVVYPEGVSASAAHELWKFTDLEHLPSPSAEGYVPFSYYLSGESEAGAASVASGLDVGKNAGITAVSYASEGPAKDVVIRTNASATSLTVNGYVDSSDNTKGDVIKHYGTAGALNVIKCALGSYHENGKVAYFEAKAGHIVFEKNSEIKHFHINANDAGTGFEEIILADNGAKELPSAITRGTVAVSGEKILVVKIISQGSAVAEEIYVYPSGSIGTTKQTETQNAGVSSALGLLVLDNGSDGANAKTGTQRDTEKEAAVNEAVQEELPAQEVTINNWADLLSFAENEGKMIGTVNANINFELFPVEFSGNKTLDLAGHALTLANGLYSTVESQDKGALVYVNKGASLVLNDSSGNDSGSIGFAGTNIQELGDAENGTFLICNNGQLTLNGGTYLGGVGVMDEGGAVSHPVLLNRGTMTINGGIITRRNAKSYVNYGAGIFFGVNLVPGVIANGFDTYWLTEERSYEVPVLTINGGTITNLASENQIVRNEKYTILSMLAGVVKGPNDTDYDSSKIVLNETENYATFGEYSNDPQTIVRGYHEINHQEYTEANNYTIYIFDDAYGRKDRTWKIEKINDKYVISNNEIVFVPCGVYDFDPQQYMPGYEEHQNYTEENEFTITINDGSKTWQVVQQEGENKPNYIVSII